jgi:SAM-dependent methyltransferase
MDSWTPPSLAFAQEPYQGKAFPHGHPDHLAAVARLFGLDPAPRERCRVLELGCGDGWNLIPMAEELSGSEFVGVDLDAARLAPGLSAKQQLGLGALELLVEDVANLGEKLGRFDYIVAHGVYSWTSEAVRAVFFEKVRSLLSDRGIAYVSANVYPGWHLIDSARNLALFHAHVKAPQAGEPFLKELRQVARFVADQMPRDTPPRALFSEQYRGLSGMSDYILNFDQLTNASPDYFEPLVRRAERSGLRYVTDAILLGGQSVRLPPNARRGIAELTQDPILREQYADFCLLPSFRQLVLAAGAVKPAEFAPARLRDLYLISSLRLPSGSDPSLFGKVEFHSSLLRLQVESPVVKTALAELQSAFPQAVAFRDLVERVAGRLRAKAHPGNELETGLFDLVAAGAVQPRTRPVSVALEPGEKPRLSAGSRLQLATFGCATNRHHTIVNLPPGFDRETLLRLDGERTRAEIAAELLALADGGAFAKSEFGPDAAADPRAAAVRRVDKTVTEAARLALLVP